MTLVNKKVDHIKFGRGVVTELSNHKIWVQFQNEIGTKVFLYPEAFEKFLKTVDPNIQENVLEELHIRQEQLELERKEKEREAAELEEQKARLAPLKRKSATKSTKRKS